MENSNRTKLYICEVCGKAHIGKEAPGECPFCGAGAGFMKDAPDARPLFLREGELSEETKKMMAETYKLETAAVAIYNCMAERAKSYEIKVMYEGLAKVELEHALIATKFLGTGKPEIMNETCSEDEAENFQRTVELEDNAVKIYSGFAKKATEQKAKIFFTALSRVEASHIELMGNYIK
jgi:rubrerythrin